MSVRTITLSVWTLLALVALTAEMIGLFVSKRFPTVGDLLRVLERSTVLRWVLLLGWFWLGWHLFVRR
jgi:hypothetical protein